MRLHAWRDRYILSDRCSSSRRAILALRRRTGRALCRLAARLTPAALPERAHRPVARHRNAAWRCVQRRGLSAVRAGWCVTDRQLGTRRAILLRAALLAAACSLFSMDRATALYPAAGLLMLGQGAVQAQHQRGGRQALRSWQPSSRRCVFAVLHGLQYWCGLWSGRGRIVAGEI